MSNTRYGRQSWVLACLHLQHVTCKKLASEIVEGRGLKSVGLGKGQRGKGGMSVCVLEWRDADLAKHDLAGTGVHHELKRLGVHIQHHLTVGDAFDGQPKPQRPIDHLPEGLQHSSSTT